MGYPQRIALPLLSLSGILLFGQQTDRLTNEDVLAMWQAGLEEQTILQAIKTKQPAFDTSVPSLVALKKAGLSENVIAAMARAASKPVPGKAVRLDESGLPIDLGIYVKTRHGRGNAELLKLGVETVRSVADASLRTLVPGMTKYVSGSISEPYSAIQTALPLEFLFRCPSGTVPGEYALLRFRLSKTSRSFRIRADGAFHDSSALHEDRVNFEWTRIGPQTYRVILTSLPAGEYGFLPPGVLRGQTLVSDGAVYTFGVE